MDACKKKKIAHYLSSQEGGWGGGDQIKIVFKIPKMSDFFIELGKNQQKKSLIFEVLKTKGGGGGDFNIVFRRQNMSDLFFVASIPYSDVNICISIC